MSSRFPRAVGLACAAALLGCSVWAQGRDLVVCADPANLPFSDEGGGGFENRLVERIAQGIGAHLVYAWQPLRRGAVGKTLGAGVCDVLAGVPADPARISTTIPYYTSSYAFVTRAAWGAAVSSLEDPRLRTSRIGVPLVGGEGAAVPPALVLARRGLSDHATGFPVYGATPVGRRMVDAVARGDIDIALVWGPAAGYYAQRSAVGLSVALVPEGAEGPTSFSIAIGVRHGEDDLRDAIDAVLLRDREPIDALLHDYGIPLVSRVDAVTRRP